MTGFLLFLCYVTLVVIVLSGLYWVFKNVDLPQPVKFGILGFVVVMGIIYFLNSGYLPRLESP